MLRAKTLPPVVVKTSAWPATTLPFVLRFVVTESEESPCRTSYSFESALPERGPKTSHLAS